jgi:nucleoside-diphosphate-sugar epimerase
MSSVLVEDLSRTTKQNTTQQNKTKQRPSDYFFEKLSSMSKSAVFITGATGFIGAQITAFALRAGFNVKLSARREAQIDSLREAFKEFADRVEFVVVPDITKSGAFDAALQGTEHVIHVASPLAKPGEDLLTPAVKGTTSVLESALKTPSIKKVVITASVASLIPLGKGGDGTVVRGESRHLQTLESSTH